jgi:hypothetical protein
MVDLEVLKAHGLDAEGLKKKFNLPREKRSDLVNRLIDRIVARCRAGRDLNLERSNVYYALDAAWDVAFNQITPTMLQTMVDKEATSEEVTRILQSAGVDPNSCIREVPDPKTPGKTIKQIDPPAFFKITVPLCMAYVKIRWAKLVNDRKQVPFLKYDPVISDELSRIRCALITESIEEQGRMYGYFDTFKQAIFQSLHFADQLMFPIEEWHSESQWVEKKSPFVAEEGTEEKKVGQSTFKRAIVKEGIRYHLPHISRSYRDQSFPVFTLNTDTGCSFAGYWKVTTWGNVAAVKGYYNLESVGYDNFYAWFSGKKSHSYWTNSLKGCAINFPGMTDADNSTSRHDSEKQISRWYSNNMADRPIVITEHYEKVIPKDEGLGDYDCPVWIRFVMAADDTVIYAAPVGYDPAVLWWGYDFVHGRTHNASMTLEVLPFQDQFSNLLAQNLLTVRQNLTNLTFIDEEIIPEKEIQKLENLGEKWWRSVNILRIRFTEALRRKVGSGQIGDPLKNAVIAHKFPYANTAEITVTMRLILDILERVLVMSAQEVGQSASHEQTREEVRQISANTSVRVQFTNTGIDSTIDAWKRQLYNAKMAHGRMSFYAQVPTEQPLSEEEMKQLGFTVKGPYNEKNKSQGIKADNGTALLYESFASDRDGQNRMNEMESARIMLELFEKVMANPITATAIGPDQAIKMVNQIGRFMGFPRDFKFENTGQTQSMQEQMGQGLQELKQYVDQTLGSLNEDLKGALGNIMDVNKDQDGVIQQIMQKLQQISQAATQAPQVPEVMPDMPQTMPASPEELASAGIISVQ